jgi:hypothetical protein
MGCAASATKAQPTVSIINTTVDAGPQDYFVYHGRMEWGDVPWSVTHVRIDSSVRRIKIRAFYEHGQLRIVILNEELEEIGAYAFGWCVWLDEIVIPDKVTAIMDGAFYACTRLTRVILGDGLEEIGEGAFRYCRLMEEIVIPNAVRAIKYATFRNCTGLTSVTLGEGLEEIGFGAFGGCTSMEEIVIPPAVRAIKERAFHNCDGLTRVTLGDGLEEIGKEAFENCTSIEHILIPPAVRNIHDTAFNGCTNLTTVMFSNEIEEFVSCDAMRDWWNQGRHEKSLRTYCFLIRCDIPARLKGISNISSWKAFIHDMLRMVPTVAAVDDHFDAIDAKLTVYEKLTLFPDQFHSNDDIVLNLLSFL